MSKIYGSRKLVILVLLVFVLAPWQLAAQERSKGVAGASGWLEQVWSLLVSVWQGAGIEDPAQNPAQQGTDAATDSSEAGMRLDPNG